MRGSARSSGPNIKPDSLENLASEEGEKVADPYATTIQKNNKRLFSI